MKQPAEGWQTGYNELNELQTMKQAVSLQRQTELLRKEYEYEKQAFRRDTEMMGIDRKVKRGDCWFPITVGRAYYNSLDRFVVEIMRTPRHRYRA